MKPNDMPYLTCGHQANSMGRKAGSTVQQPACVICGCFDVAEEQPDLEGRMARCTFYGKRTRKNECNVCSKGDGICQCERPTSEAMAFKKLHPDKDHDEFYCGCHSWD